MLETTPIVPSRPAPEAGGEASRMEHAPALPQLRAPELQHDRMGAQAAATTPAQAQPAAKPGLTTPPRDALNATRPEGPQAVPAPQGGPGAAQQLPNQVNYFVGALTARDTELLMMRELAKPLRRGAAPGP